jgi:methionyl-tRNA synthetase
VELPRRVFGHGFLNVEGQKMSKSLGNVITPEQLRAEFGVDPTRYFLMREVPYGGDGSISREAIVQRINGDLANDLGNLAQRVLSFVQRNAGAAVPTPGAFTAEDKAMIDAGAAALETARAEMKDFAIHRYLEAVWRTIGDANRYVDKQAPWTLRKSDPARMATVLYVCIESIRRAAILVQPVMPDSAGKMLDQLAVPADKRGFADLATPIAAGTALPPPTGVFPRIAVAEAAKA